MRRWCQPFRSSFFNRVGIILYRSSTHSFLRNCSKIGLGMIFRDRELCCENRLSKTRQSLYLGCARGIRPLALKLKRRIGDLNLLVDLRFIRVSCLIWSFLLIVRKEIKIILWASSFELKSIRCFVFDRSRRNYESIKILIVYHSSLDWRCIMNCATST